MSTNTELAKMFHTMATVLEIKGENGFKVNANTKVARAIEDLVEDITSMEDLTSIPALVKVARTKFRNTSSMALCQSIKN